ncbi:MAG: DNA polymerase I, partial [Limisphaerales bacterium]
ADTPHRYALVTTAEDRRALAARLAAQPAYCFDTETDGLNPREARMLGVAFSFEAGEGFYVAVAAPEPAPRSSELRRGEHEPPPASDPGLTGARPSAPCPPELKDFLPVFANPASTKIGHNLKFDLQVIRAHGVAVAGPLFDTMIAHALVEPEQRHGMDYLSEVYLGYTPVPITQLIGPKDAPQRSMADVPVEQVADYAAEDADVTWQLYGKLRPLLAERAQGRVFYEVEMPVLPALAAMEFEGIRVDAAALAEFSVQLAKEIAAAEADLHRLAGREFNVNSNKQLGEVLFNELKLVEKPRKTPTGQFATDEQTLLALAGSHEIVRRILDYRAATKLKSTYADALPQAISPRTGRVHTTYTQAATATGRLSSNDPNLQNIPIRTELGQEIRRAFVARDADHVLLSADYSQIELRIIASISREEAMLEAFRGGEDIHRSTAARVFGVPPAVVTPEQRRRAKMVNFGIAYGMSAHGLAQRLGIPRGEAAAIIEQYFASFPGIRGYMDETIAFAKQHGYAETLTGRRRWLRDITSANATVRAAAERNAINAPIQGTAADMIKLAMGAIHAELLSRGLRTRMLLQVHDELIFDVPRAEEAEVRALVAEKMRDALPLAAPIEVGLGTGANWLAAH